MNDTMENPGRTATGKSGWDWLKSKIIPALIILLVSALALTACIAHAGRLRPVPQGLPEDPGNPLTEEKIELGKKLFFDRRLSR